MTTFTTDDYYYACFWRDGFDGFVRRNVDHYLTRNGRVLVHLIAQTLLAGGMIPFAIFNTLSLIAIFLCFMAFQSMPGKKTHGGGLLSAFLFSIMLLGLNYNVLKHSILCVSDACNYIFPQLLLALSCMLLEKCRTSPGIPLCFFTALGCFLSGATTEQGGIMTLTILFVSILSELIVQKRVGVFRVFLLLCSAAGYLTIFLSPATRARAASELSIPGIQNGLRQFACNFASPGRSLFVMILFCLVIGTLSLLNRKLPRVLLLGLPVSATLSIGYFSAQSVALNVILFLLFCGFMLTAAVIFIFKTPYQKSGSLLLAGLASAGMMIFTVSSSVRATVPLLICLMVCGAFFAGECYEILGIRFAGKKFFHRATAILSVCAFFCCLNQAMPVFRGVRNNYRILQQNELAAQTARQEEVFRYRDYLPPYYLADLFTSSVFDRLFLHYYRIDDVPVEYNYRVMEFEKTGETTLLKDGKRYHPLSKLVKKHGGKLFWASNEYLSITLKRREFIYNAPCLYWTDQGTRHRVNVVQDIINYENSLFVSEDFAKILLG
ncbi:hypothetical protein H8695_02560 [Clostridiales bacterium BX7]|uniref:Uncharacterized protein n=2 Tax=Feifania hominis TaxID=2763660 RepID=A0A926DCH5_9FIRM|nr:hypothetical protein [Feifania hominis]